MRFAMMFNITSELPPSMEFAFERNHCRVVNSSVSSNPPPDQPSACVPIMEIMISQRRMFWWVP